MKRAARTIGELLELRYRNFDAESLVLVDKPGRRPGQMPTKRNILRGMQWLVDGLQPGHCCFMYYQGLVFFLWKPVFLLAKKPEQKNQGNHGGF